MKNNKFHIYIWGITFLISILFSNCTDYDAHTETNNRDEVLLNLLLEVPGTSTSKLRSITSANEEKIDQINVLVFTKDGPDGDEIFSYIAPIKDQQSIADKKIVVKLTKTSANVNARLVVIANTKIPSTEDFIGKTKSQVLDMITFDANGKWNTESENDYRALPMWGESDARSIDSNTTFASITLLRSLARIDICLNATNLGNAAESAGIDNYDLKEVYLYRSLNKGFVAPDPSVYSEGKVSQPTVPSSATKNERIDYLALTDPTQLIRTIYTVENYGYDQDESTAIVVGFADSKGAGSISYYRLDFLDSSTNTYMNLLRNHRYMVNIKSINGEGFDTPDAALNAGPANVDWDVIAWDENTINAGISGNYYLGVDRRELMFEHQDETSINVKLTTNIPADKLEFSWKNKDQEDFEYSFDSTTFILTFKVLIPEEIEPDPDPDEPGEGEGEDEDEDETETVSRTIKMTSDSISQGDIIQYFNIKSGGIDLEIKVQEEMKKQPYEIICSTVRHTGYIRKDVPLDDENTIILTLRSNTDDIIGYEYEVYTPVVAGISFYAKGKFTERVEEIVLKGKGTPTTEGAITLPFILNSSILNGCGTTVNSVFSGIRILPIAYSNSKSGYAAQNSASRSVLRAKQNFGLTDSSKVKVDGIEIMSLLQTKSGGFLDHQSIELDLQKNPDIVILGHYVSFDDFTNKAFKDYLEKGGIMILFQEASKSRLEESVLYFFEYLWPDSKLSASRIYSGGRCHPIINIEDPITVGPFGDVRKKHWGEDASATLSIIGIPSKDITIYSTSTKNTNKVVMFKHNKYNLFWAGDGGFLSNYDNRIGPSYLSTSRPFTIDEKYNPIPNTKYSKPVYNSIIFANVMAWAISKINNGEGIN